METAQATGENRAACRRQAKRDRQSRRDGMGPAKPPVPANIERQVRPLRGVPSGPAKTTAHEPSIRRETGTPGGCLKCRRPTCPVCRGHCYPYREEEAFEVMICSQCHRIWRPTPPDPQAPPIDLPKHSDKG